MLINPLKAGTGGADRAHIEAVIYEASKGTRFFEEQKRRHARTADRIARLKAHAARVTRSDLAEAEQTIAHRRAAIEAAVLSDVDADGRPRVMVHCDLDAFYASVHEVDEPQWRTVPMAVGGTGGDGVLTTANYVARRFGIRSAMPTWIARKLCPQLAVLDLDFAKYRVAAAKVRTVFSRYDPRFRSASLDEASLDLTPYLAEHPELTPAQAVEAMRAAIHAETGLTASAGIAANTMLAKIASDANKPNGQLLVPFDRLGILAFVGALPVRKFPGIGAVTDHVLDAFGVLTGADIAAQMPFLWTILTPALRDYLLCVSMGVPSGAALPPAPPGASSTPGGDAATRRSGISSERTFKSTASLAFLQAMLRDQCATLADDLRRSRVFARTLTFKIKKESFAVLTRSRSTNGYVRTAGELYRHVEPMLLAVVREHRPPTQWRLLGVRASGLV
ncbi:hypothetical protein CXG81DRAFT_8815, partial [Caulochytrium protostelioides]